MLKIATSKLSMPSTRLMINVSSNRPNMVYATRRLVGATSNYHNLDFLIPVPYHAPMLLQKGVIETGMRMVSRPKSEMEETPRKTLLVGDVYKGS